MQTRLLAPGLVFTDDTLTARVEASATFDSALPDLIVDGNTVTLTAGPYAYHVQVINGGILEITGLVTITADIFWVDAASTVDGVGGGEQGGGCIKTFYDVEFSDLGLYERGGGAGGPNGGSSGGAIGSQGTRDSASRSL